MSVLKFSIPQTDFPNVYDNGLNTVIVPEAKEITSLTLNELVFFYEGKNENRNFLAVIKGKTFLMPLDDPTGKGWFIYHIGTPLFNVRLLQDEQEKKGMAGCASFRYYKHGNGIGRWVWVVEENPPNLIETDLVDGDLYYCNGSHIELANYKERDGDWIAHNVGDKIDPEWIVYTRKGFYKPSR